MASSLDTFVKEGKFKFKDFARTILTDIGLMIAKMYMFQAIQAGLGAFGINLPGIPGKAMGGPVGKGMPYMVGEKGPELFVPKQAGTIIPNSKINSTPAATAPQAPGPVTNVYNNYSISAIDSQSVAQFFAQNRKMALGAVEMAKKELPYGVG
jgi:phage-related minor tail protein